MYEALKFNLKRYIAGEDGLIWSKAKDCNAFLCGGAITSLFSNNQIHDYDFYFRNIEELTNFQSFLLENDYYQVEDSLNAITLRESKHPHKIFQLIKKSDYFFGSALDCINKFDFTVCMGAFDFANDSFVLNEDFMCHLAQKRLVYNINGKYPISSLYRIKKYLTKGFVISAAELVKISLAIHNLDLTNLGVLKDQLMGIDTLVFKQLTDELENKSETPYTFEEVMSYIDRYLCFEENETYG